MSSPTRPRHVPAVATALFVTFLWSSSWVLIRWGLDEESLEPLTFAALRYGMAAAVLAAWVSTQPPLRRTVLRLDRSSIAQVAALGVLLYAVTQGAQFVAIDSQPAATSSLVLSLTPLLIAIVGGRFIAERSSNRQIGGSVLVVAGAWLYFSGELGATVVGMVAALVGLGGNTASALLGRHVNRRAALPPIMVTALSMAVGAGILVTIGIVAEGVPSVSPRAWLLIGWLALVNTALAFTLWNWSLRSLSALESAAINNTMLIQIAVLAWMFLGEPLGVAEIAGIALVTVGVLMTQTLLSRKVRSGRDEGVSFS